MSSKNPERRVYQLHKNARTPRIHGFALANSWPIFRVLGSLIELRRISELISPIDAKPLKIRLMCDPNATRRYYTKPQSIGLPDQKVNGSNSTLGAPLPRKYPHHKPLVNRVFMYRPEAKLEPAT